MALRVLCVSDGLCLLSIMRTPDRPQGLWLDHSTPGAGVPARGEYVMLYPSFHRMMLTHYMTKQLFNLWPRVNLHFGGAGNTPLE